MNSNFLYNSLVVDKEVAVKLNFNPYYPCLGSGVSGQVRLGNRKFFDLASNNYLGLANDSRILDAMKDGLSSYGASMCGTPIATGYTDRLQMLEKKISGFLGLEDSIVFPSCYQANTGLFQTIASREDLILVDHYVHASLIQGIRSAGCKVKPFLHNNMDHLKKNLKDVKEKYRQVFIVTESVFSTEGAVAPLKGIINIGKEFEALIIVDDSHGVGVLGKNGKGILEEMNIKDFDGIYTASLGKAVALSGGVISGKSVLIDYLRYSCPNYIYSTAIAPAIVEGLLIALEIIENEFFERGSRLFANRNKIHHALSENEFALARSKTPIISIFCGSVEKTISLALDFFEQELLTTPFVPPSVPQGKGVLRLIPGAGIDGVELDEIINRVIRIRNAT